MLNEEIVTKQVAEIERALQVLESHQTVSAVQLERSLELRWTVERGLEVVMQSVLSIAAHLLSAQFRNDWEDYTALIEKLGVHGVMPDEFCEKFKGMVGFRNILVHEYVEIDLSIVERVMKEELGSFREFVTYVLQYLERTKSNRGG